MYSDDIRSQPQQICVHTVHMYLRSDELLRSTLFEMMQLFSTLKSNQSRIKCPNTRTTTFSHMKWIRIFFSFLFRSLSRTSTLNAFILLR